MKYCTKCGAQAPEDALYCGKCGTKLDVTGGYVVPPCDLMACYREADERKRRISMLEEEEEEREENTRARVYGGGAFGGVVSLVLVWIASGNFFLAFIVGVTFSFLGALIGKLIDVLCSRNKYTKDPIRFTELLDSYGNPNRSGDALVGGALFGTTGAVVGAASGNDKAVFRVTYESGRVKTETVDKGSYQYNLYMQKLK